MESIFFLRGVIIGVSIAAPVGPIGLLCFQRTLAKGWPHGLVSGLGAATADAIYGLTAALGLSTIITGLADSGSWLQFSGGVFLCWLGLTVIWAKAATPEITPAGSLTRDYVTTFMLTLANPMTILAFIAIFAGVGVVGLEDNHSLTLVFGVFLGSAFWWAALTTVAACLKRRFSAAHIRWMNRLSGTAILGFGIWMVASLLFS